jgi:hypothetical protein
MTEQDLNSMPLEGGSRRAHLPIKVHCLPGERNTIRQKAEQCGLSASAYLRALGCHYEPKSLLDHRAVADLIRINGDQGRLGGLLKMWLSRDGEEGLPSIASHGSVHLLLAEIRSVQERLKKAVIRL